MGKCKTCRFWNKLYTGVHGMCEQITNGDETYDYDVEGYWVKNTYDLMVVIDGNNAKDATVTTREGFGCILHEERPSEA